MKNLTVQTALIAALTLALGGCIGGNRRALVEDTDMAVPTLAGNGRVRTTNAGGLYASTTGTSPDGAAMADACLQFQMRWIRFLREENLLPTQNTWNNWWQQQRYAGVADRCTDYATFGAPMSGGAINGIGGGQFNGRTFKE